MLRHIELQESDSFLYYIRLKDCQFSDYVVQFLDVRTTEVGEKLKLGFRAFVISSPNNQYKTLSDKERKRLDKFLGDVLVALIELQHTSDPDKHKYYDRILPKAAC